MSVRIGTAVLPLSQVALPVTVAFGRVDDQVALAIDAEVPGPPVLYAVGLKRLFDGRGQLLAPLPPLRFVRLRANLSGVGLLVRVPVWFEDIMDWTT